MTPRFYGRAESAAKAMKPEPQTTNAHLYLDGMDWMAVIYDYDDDGSPIEETYYVEDPRDILKNAPEGEEIDGVVTYGVGAGQCMLLRLGTTETLPDVRAVATEFRRVLRERLTPAELDEIDGLNAAEHDPTICHSHDFTDGEQAIIDTLARFGIEHDPHDCRHAALVNGAWSIAKADGFGAPIA